MIVYLTQGVSRIAFRIKTYDQSQLADWHGLQLLIIAGEAGQPCDCGVGGSPWFFYGCWPGVRTGEDVANTRPADVPVMSFPAFNTDNEGRVIFRLGDKLSTIPPGRYTGIIRLVPKMKPLNMVPLYSLGKEPEPEKAILPPEFAFGEISCSDNTPAPRPKPKKPEPACCTLAVFDIDLGPECSDHFIDQTAVTLMLNNCTMEIQ